MNDVKVRGFLRTDPLDYVRKLESPIGIYLRREVFKRENENDMSLRIELRKKIASEQLKDGSWGGIFVHTANNLWDLINMGYGIEDAAVKKTVEWLFSIQQYRYRGYPGFFYSGHREDASIMRSTLYGEFGPGCTLFYQTTYAVQLLTRLGFENDPRVRTTVDSYMKFWRPDWCGTWCATNVLRMLIQHPDSSESRQVRTALKFLEDRQTKTGFWKRFRFYHIFHALSRSRLPLARKQLENASPLVAKRQNRDGSWGREKKENDTFLVLDALNNINAL